LGEETKMGIVAEKTAEKVVSQLQQPAIPKWLMPTFGSLIGAAILALFAMAFKVVSLETKIDAATSPQVMVDVVEERIMRRMADDERRRIADDAVFRADMQDLKERLRVVEKDHP